MLHEPFARELGETKLVTTEAKRLPRVLVVDDEPLMGATLRVALEDDFDVTIAQSGDEAKRYLESNTYDAVLCDLMMPGTNGIDLHGWIVARDPALAERMVFMTGGAYTEQSQDFLEHVGRHRVDKPFRMDALLSLLGRVARAEG